MCVHDEYIRRLNDAQTGFVLLVADLAQKVKVEQWPIVNLLILSSTRTKQDKNNATKQQKFHFDALLFIFVSLWFFLCRFVY